MDIPVPSDGLPNSFLSLSVKANGFYPPKIIIETKKISLTVCIMNFFQLEIRVLNLLAKNLVYARSGCYTLASVQESRIFGFIIGGSIKYVF